MDATLSEHADQYIVVAVMVLAVLALCLPGLVAWGRGDRQAPAEPEPEPEPEFDPDNLLLEPPTELLSGPRLSTWMIPDPEEDPAWLEDLELAELEADEYE